MIAKCGRIYIWHWAHDGSDCDPWHEPEASQFADPTTRMQ
jgi:competence CoiA-like predicted nuclease